MCMHSKDKDRKVLESPELILVQQPLAPEAAGYLKVTGVPENCIASSISSRFEFK